MKNIFEINLEKKESLSGNLSFFEVGKEIDFDIKRIYYIYNLNQKKNRGYHAHKKLKQVMWCPYGIIEIKFDDGEKIKSYILDDPTKIIIVNKGYWREFMALKEESILCIAASDIYDEKDYIRDYDEYKIWIGKDE